MHDRTHATRPRQGELAGLDIRDLRGSARRRIAVVFQQFNLVSRLTALQNVLAGRLGYVPPWRGWTRRSNAETTARARMPGPRRDCSGRRPSAPTRCRAVSNSASRSRVRSHSSRTSSWRTSPSQASIRRSVQASSSCCAAFARDGVAVVCSLHQVHFARQFADRIMGLANGRVEVDAPVAQFDQRAADRLYAGEDARASLA